ncbi:MAG: cysteine desulfurase-like protein [Thermoanaerobaculia bacterium]
MAYGENEARRARNDFPSLAREVNGRPLAYLDGPAGTQVPNQVIDAISDVYRNRNANTHGAFLTSRESDALISSARDTVATFLGAKERRSISFGQNMTTLSFSLAHALSRLIGEGDEVVISALDHEANRGPWRLLIESGAVIREIALRPDGTLDPEEMARQITKNAKLVALGWASNALGTVNDVALARRLSREAGAWLLVDAVHYAPHFPIDVTELDPDFLLCSAYKFYGPHVGILYSRPGLLDEIPTDRLITQEPHAPERIETGTLNHAAIGGVKAAVEYIAAWGEGKELRSRVVSALEQIGGWEHELAAYYHENVRSIAGVKVWGQDFTSTRRAPTVSITVDGMPSDDVAEKLASKGIAVWSGDFYARRPVEILGINSHGGLVRTGFSMYNTREEVDRLLEALRTL